MYTCIVKYLVTDSIFVLSVVVMYTQAMGSKEWREVGTGVTVVDLNHHCGYHLCPYAPHLSVFSLEI